MSLRATEVSSGLHERREESEVQPVETHASKTDEPLSAEEAVEPRYVHPTAARWFRKVPWLRYIPILGISIEGFGPSLTFSLGMCYFVLKGVSDNMIIFARQPTLVKKYGIDGNRYQRLASLYAMGWSVKALTAMGTDTFAWFGYTKRWYMLASCVVGAGFALGFGLLPVSPASANPAAAFIFLTSYGKANVDILSEGHYSRLIRENPKAGPALISWIWVTISVGTIVASVIQGPLSDANIVQVGIFISAALQLLTGVFFIFNWYGEKTNREERAQDAILAREEWLRAESAIAATEEVVTPPKQLHPEFSTSDEDPPAPLADVDLLGFSNDLVVGAEVQEAEEAFELPPIPTCMCGVFEINKQVALCHWRILLYSALMTCSVITMACITILGTTWDLLYACIVISVACCSCSFWALPLVIAKANVFGYLNTLLYLKLPGALDSFYLADKDCLPDGPHFSYSFYNTISAVVGNIGAVAGVSLFTYVFSKHSYRLSTCITVLIQIVASVFDLIMVKRWNVYIGIPDHVMYICGDSIIYQVCHMLAYMPQTILMARLCPRGSESMVYALMAGFGNMGSSMSSTIGSLIMEFAWPVKTKGVCDFSNVPWLLLTGHFGMPLLIVPLAFLLLPAARVCDDIDVDGHAIRQEAAKEQHKASEQAGPAVEKAMHEPQSDAGEVNPSTGVAAAPDGLQTEAQAAVVTDLTEALKER